MHTKEHTNIFKLRAKYDPYKQIFFSTKIISLYKVYEPFKFSLSDILKLNKHINNIINIKVYQQRSTPSPSNIYPAFAPGMLWYMYMVSLVFQFKLVTIPTAGRTKSMLLYTQESLSIMMVQGCSQSISLVSGRLGCHGSWTMHFYTLFLYFYFFFNCLLSEVKID